MTPVVVWVTSASASFQADGPQLVTLSAQDGVI